MAEPMILELLGNLKTRVATNEVNIANNTSTITANKALFDTHTADDNRHWTTLDRQNFDRVVHFKGYFTSEAKLKESYPTGQVGDYAIVGATDTVWAWDDTTSKWLNTTEQGIVISVNGRTGEVVLTKTDVGLSNVDNTSDVNKPISTAQQAALNDKADRGLITKAQADGNTLRSGIYYLNEDYTILGDTTMYWSIIHCEALNKTGHGIDGTSNASQIWINFQTNGSGKIYYRRQQYDYDTNQRSWSEFKELATTIDISNLQTQITTNTSNIAKNISDIAQNASDIVTNANKIAANTKLITDNKTATDAAIKANSDKIETNKTNIAKNATDIATNKTNIQTNATNIATNTTNINNLTNDKADRLKITLAQANSLTLKAGIYNLQGKSLTILGEASAFWTIIVGEYNDNGKSVTQIWMPYIYGNNVKPKMFIRRALSDSNWSAFTEVLTTDIASKDDISRFKQYKGYYATASDLKTALTTSSDGDYAIVGSALYIWNSKQSTWTEVSGSGGSTGTGKWSIRQYDAPNGLIPSGTPYMKDIVGLTLEAQWEVDDAAALLTQAKVDYKAFLIETWVKVNEAFEWTQTYRCDDGCSIYLNGQIIAFKSGSSQNNNISIQFKKGWNKLQILLREKAEEEIFLFASKITDEIECLGIDCYHSENDLTEGYVPLVGDSTIEGNIIVDGTLNTTGDATIDGTLTTTGNITSGGTVGVTSNAYLQYNESDKSISFIFN